MMRLKFGLAIVIMLIGTLGLSFRPPFPQVSAGAFFSCVRDGDGRINCWGENLFGQTDQPHGEFTEVSTGWLHACALRADRTVTCWSYNEQGQTNVPEEEFLQISTGNLHTCGITKVQGPPLGVTSVTSDQRVLCWGDNRYGQSAVPERAESEDFVQIAAGGYFTCALTENGIAICWGDDARGQTEPPPGISFRQISAGSEHACGVTRDTSEVICWGRSIAELDRRMQAEHIVQPSERSRGAYRATSVVQVSAGARHTCILSTEGEVFCWGDNSSGQLDAPDEIFVQISAGWYHTCGVTHAGQVRCWGNSGGAKK